MPAFNANTKDMQLVLHEVIKASEQNIPGYDEMLSLIHISEPTRPY